MSRTFKKSKLAYLVEFLIIIAGITVSFAVNEWKENNKLEEKKEHLLVDINIDLHSDSLVLENMIRYYQMMANSHDTLLVSRDTELNRDTLTDMLDHFTSYYPFNETANTYKRINTDNDLSIERGDSLIWYYLNLHNVIYPNFREMIFVEKDFVLNTALPYMDQNAPFIYPSPINKSFDGIVFYELRKKDEFMNYLKSGRVYKQAMLRAATNTFTYVKHLKKLVKTQVKKNNSKD